jgi:hypothetical protein
MSNLSKLVEKGAGLSINQENMVKEFKQAKEDLQRHVSASYDIQNVLWTNYDSYFISLGG